MVADMEVHTVADMEVDKVASIVVDMASDKKTLAHMEFDIVADKDKVEFLVPSRGPF